MDDAVHDHSAHGYYITRMEVGVRYSCYCYILNIIKHQAKTVIHIVRELDLVTFHMKDNLSDVTSKINVR